MTQKMATRTKNDVAQRLRGWRGVHLTKVGALCDDAAAEIERLQKVIDDYVYVAQASAKEILHLRLENAMTDRDTFAAAAAEEDGTVAPLYRHPPCQDFSQKNLTLTDAEREAVEWCVEMARLHATECDEEIAALRGLLERLK